MIALYAGKALGFLKLVPLWVWAALAVLLVAFLWGNHRDSQGYDRRSAEYAVEARLAVEKARTADGAARATVDAEKATTGARTDAARKAAAESDDPLRAGLDSLAKERRK